MTTEPVARPTREPLFHLPKVDEKFAAEVRDHFLEAARQMPDFHMRLPREEADFILRAPVDTELYVMIVPIAEMILERRDEVSADTHANLAILAGLPAMTEVLALQIAFGRRVGEQRALKIAGLAARAAAQGMSVTRVSVHPGASEKAPRDPLLRLFLGEIRRAPNLERLAVGIARMRETSALVPEALRSPMLCTIAWLEWARGNRALSLAYLSEATRLEPDVTAVRGLRQMFASRMPAWTAAVVATAAT